MKNFLPPMLRFLEDRIGSGKDFEKGANQLGQILIQMEQRSEPSDTLLSIFASKAPARWMEHFTFCLFSTGPTHLQIGLRALELKSLGRIIRKANNRHPLDSGERKLITSIHQTSGNLFKLDMNQYSNQMRETLVCMIQEKKFPDDLARKNLVNVLRLEAEAAKLRVQWLSENADPYDMIGLSRLLPRLRIFDEAIYETLGFAEKLEKKQDVFQRSLFLQKNLQEKNFQKLLQKSKDKNELKPLIKAWELQTEKMVPVRDLVVLSTIYRWLSEIYGSAGHPMFWVNKSLKTYLNGSFKIPLGKAEKIIRPKLKGGGWKISDGCIEGDFRSNAFPKLIARDMLTIPWIKVEEEKQDIKTFVSCNITRDDIILALLDNPKFTSLPGIVSYIATMTRSLQVLEKICKNRPLYTGASNRDVPVALLTHPSQIPIQLLKPLFHTRYVALWEFKQLERQGRSLRREVWNEVKEFLGQMS